MTSTIRSVAFLAMGMALLAPPAAAARDSCPAQAGTIDVNFQTQSRAPSYNNTLNVTGIRNLIHERGTAVAGPHTQALGVTIVTPSFGLEAHTQYLSQDGGYCVYLRGVDATFGFHDLDVYVASEYPPGSCEYRTILDHENQHVAINKNGLLRDAPLVRAALEQLVAEVRPVFSADPHAATQAITADLSRRMQASLDSFENDLAQRHAQIDTNSNYKATSEVCRDWDRGNVWPQQSPHPAAARAGS
jgi:hypothetical protein